MKQFIARFEKQIYGTLSGFDRVVFRGSLRRLTHPQGMKMYLIQNGILCKQYQDHVKQVSQELKEASLAPFRQQQLVVQHVQIGLTGCVPDWVAGEVNTSLKSHLVGDRLKHWIQGNSLKSYGKAHTPAGDVFRVETMTSNVRIFRTYRPAEGGPQDQLAWRPMRLGVADLHRRSEVSQKANNRYLDAFATVDDTTRFSELIQPLEQPCQYNGRRVRALRPFQPDDHSLLATINRGEFALNGFRNRDLQPLLHAGGQTDSLSLSPLERRRRSAAISRKLRVLRAHGLIQKVPKTHRYQLTPTGRLAINAILTMHETSLSLLSRAAA